MPTTPLAKQVEPPSKPLEKLVEDALNIIAAFGVPLTGLTTRRKQKMAKAFLAVAAMKPGLSWSAVKSNDDGHRLRSREVIKWMNAHLGENISDGSYDDIRRKDLIFLVEAGIVLGAAEHAGAKTNDGTRANALQPEFAEAMRSYGKPEWNNVLAQVMKNRKKLIETLARKRGLSRIPIQIEGEQFSLSPGNHNLVQKAVVELFLPAFGNGAEVLHLGDAEEKYLFHNREKLEALGFFELAHDKLPDVVAFSKKKNWLFLIEAVDTSNPITELRKEKFDSLTRNCKPAIVYVTAFSDRATFRKFSKDIAWETEVWIVESPEHMVHFNGDKFLGPYRGKLDGSA